MTEYGHLLQNVSHRMTSRSIFLDCVLRGVAVERIGKAKCEEHQGKRTNMERQKQEEVLQLLQSAEQPQTEHSLIESSI